MINEAYDAALTVGPLFLLIIRISIPPIISTSNFDNDIVRSAI
jgi:hypothetical protein